MPKTFNRIPSRDILGSEINVGDKAVVFSKHGINYEVTLVEVEGKRWLQVDEECRIGGLGNHFILKCS